MGWISLRAPSLCPAFAALAAATAAVFCLLTTNPVEALSRQSASSGIALPTRFAQCPQFFAHAQPPRVAQQPALRELCYEAFAVLHSGVTRTPVFVAQRLNRRLVEDADEKRAKRFFADARLPRNERAELEDYKGSGYSRGHMAPAGDMPTPTAMAQSFSLANMVPQNLQHNVSVRLSHLSYQAGLQQAAWPSSCMGGQGTDPNEQNTQQSPGLGRKTVRQLSHS